MSLTKSAKQNDFNLNLGPEQDKESLQFLYGPAKLPSLRHSREVLRFPLLRFP